MDKGDFARSEPYIDLTQWGEVTHIGVGKFIIIGSDIGLSPGRRKAIIWTNAVILLIWTLRTNFSEILIEIHISSLKKRIWKYFLRDVGLNVLKDISYIATAPCYQTPVSDVTCQLTLCSTGNGAMCVYGTIQPIENKTVQFHGKKQSTNQFITFITRYH